MQEVDASPSYYQCQRNQYKQAAPNKLISLFLIFSVKVNYVPNCRPIQRCKAEKQYNHEEPVDVMVEYKENCTESLTQNKIEY